jgi:hypothetical protein
VGQISIGVDKLKRMYAELALDVAAMKDLIAKKL